MFCKSKLLLLAFAASTTLARNDWSKPCFDGQCSYDLPDTGSQHGTLRIWGANHAITDITPASGWIILGCDPNVLEQTVRIVCQGDESDVNGCGHLFKSLGKSGKLVRLPENCGKNAFGRLAKVEVDKDQQIPAHVASQLAGRSAGRTRVVRSVTLDTNFHAINVADTGTVNITVEGATFPGAPSVGPPLATGRRAERDALLERAVDKRGFWDWIEHAFDDFNNFNLTEAKNITVIDFDHSYNLFNYALSCPPATGHAAYTGGFRCDFRAAVSAVATVGIAAVGTIIPPDLSQFGVFAGADASFNGILSLDASLTGRAGTGMIELWSIGLPGLNWPGILSLGPTFKINAQASALIDVAATIDASLCYTISSTKLFYPKSSKPSFATVAPCQSLDSLVVTSNYPSQASVVTHFQPRFDLSVNAFEGVASATVFLAADATANATFSLSTSSTPQTFNGCFDVRAGLDVYAGAEASFFDLFDDSTSFNLYNANWDVYNRCFNPSIERSELEPLLTLPGPGSSAPSCPGIGPQNKIKLV